MFVNQDCSRVSVSFEKEIVYPNLLLALRARHVKIIFLECSHLIHLFGQRSSIGPTVWAGEAVTD